VFSPRAAFLIKPKADQTIRVTYNRAFRSPSMINNNLNVTVANPLPLGLINPAFGSAVFLVPTTALGNQDLKEEHIDAFEVSYTGNVLDRVTVSAATYFTKFSNEIFFTTSGTWTTPPPGFPGLGPFPPAALWGALIQQGIVFPSSYTYKNLGQEKNKGIELGVDGRLTKSVTAFANYSFQADPVPSFPGLTAAQAANEINRPAKNRYNLGLSCSTAHGFGSLTVTHADKAFWQDVLDDRFHGETAGYTMVNLTLGTKWGEGKYTGSLKMTNLNNRQVMQHVFGDVIRRQIVAELKIGLPK
jgi:outer membrane receptor protein involved in Fe transport